MEIRDKFNLQIRNADQTETSQAGDVQSADSDTATTTPSSTDTVEQFSPPLSSDLPQLDEPSFPFAELTGTASPSATPVIDSGREEIAHQSEIHEGNPLNPFVSIFESSPTIDPVLIPGDGSVAPGSTAFPDKLASVDPRQNLPENLRRQSFNLPGLDLNTSPDHFGIDLTVGGLSDRNNLNQILGFGATDNQSGVQIKGVNVFGTMGRNWGLVSGLTESWKRDSNTGGWTHDISGTDDKGNVITRSENYSPDGSKMNYTENVVYSGGIGMEKTTGTRTSDGYKEVTQFKDENGQVIGTREVVKDKDGIRTDNKDANGQLQSYIYTNSSDGVTTVYDKDGNPTSQWDKDGNFIPPTTDDEYMDPEGGPAVQTNLANLTLEDFLRLKNSKIITNTTPSNVDDQQPINIDPKKVYDPLKDPLVTDGNPDFYESQILATGNIDVIRNPEGGDPAGPKDDGTPPPPPTTIPDN